MQAGPGKSPRRYGFLSLDLRRRPWDDRHGAVASWHGPDPRHAGGQDGRQEYDLLSTHQGQTAGRMRLRSQVMISRGDRQQPAECDPGRFRASATGLAYIRGGPRITTAVPRFPPAVRRL